MCASLAARGDPSEELELAVSLINRVLSGITGAMRALHICRGNWSPDESRLLSGDYAPLAPYLDQLEVDQLVLEYATARAGHLHSFGDKALGLGVVNPRTPDIETPEAIAASVRLAAVSGGPAVAESGLRFRYVQPQPGRGPGGRKSEALRHGRGRPDGASRDPGSRAWYHVAVYMNQMILKGSH